MFNIYQHYSVGNSYQERIMTWWAHKIWELRWILDHLLPSLKSGAETLLLEVSLKVRQAPVTVRWVFRVAQTTWNDTGEKVVFFSILLCPFVLCRRESLRLVLNWVCNTSLTLVTLPFNQERAGPPNLEPWADNHASSDWMLFLFHRIYFYGYFLFVTGNSDFPPTGLASIFLFTVFLNEPI